MMTIVTTPSDFPVHLKSTNEKFPSLKLGRKLCRALLGTHGRQYFGRHREPESLDGPGILPVSQQ